MIRYITWSHLAPIKQEIKFTSDDPISIGDEIQCGLDKEGRQIIKPIVKIIEQRPAKGDWKVRPDFYHVSVVE